MGNSLTAKKSVQRYETDFIDAKIKSLGYLEEKLTDTLLYVQKAKELEERHEDADIKEIIQHIKTDVQVMTVTAHTILTHDSFRGYNKREEEQTVERDGFQEILIAYPKAMRDAIEDIKHHFNILEEQAIQEAIEDVKRQFDIMDE